MSCTNVRLLAIALMLAGATAGCTRDELAAVDQIEASLTGKVVTPEPAALPPIPEPEPEPVVAVAAPVMLAKLPDPPPPECFPVFRLVECP